MELLVTAIATTPNSTGSMMSIDGKPFCFVVEDGYHEIKVPGETRIPAGRYRIVKRTYGKFFSRYKKLHGHSFALEIKDVPNFNDVLIHAGNTIKDTRGCLLVNALLGFDATGNFYGAESMPVYKALYNYIATAFECKEEVWLEIIR